MNELFIAIAGLEYPRLRNWQRANNKQDFTDSGIAYLYQEDAYVTAILPDSGLVNEPKAIIISGNNFVNSTFLKCRIGEYVSSAVFVSRMAVLCYTPRIPLISPEQV